jgi:hypothetical protein
VFIESRNILVRKTSWNRRTTQDWQFLRVQISRIETHVYYEVCRMYAGYSELQTTRTVLSIYIKQLIPTMAGKKRNHQKDSPPSKPPATSPSRRYKNKQCRQNPGEKEIQNKVSQTSPAVTREVNIARTPKTA